MDVSAGSHAVQVTATASDAGGAGVSRVIVYFDKELSQTQHHWTGYSSKVVVDGMFTNDSFSDATPGSATNVLSLNQLTRPGSYNVVKVAVEDMAGNRTVYTAGQLKAMGINTAVQVTGGVDDKAAPTLRAFSLPSTLDLGSGQATLTVTGEAQDAGGSGLTGATIEFDRPLSFSDGERSTLGIGSTRSFIQIGEPLPLGSGPTIVTSATASGTYQVTKVTVRDDAGNVSTYTAEQLKSLGMNTSLLVTGGSAPVTPTASVLASDAADGFVVTVASPDLSSSGSTSFKLVMRYDANMVKYTGVTLSTGATGNVSAEVSENGSASTLTITGSGSFTSGSGIRIAMDPLRETLRSNLEVEQFSVNGNAQTFSKGKSAAMMEGSSGSDLFNVVGSGVIDGGAGFDTVMLEGARSSTAVTKTSAGLEVTHLGVTNTLVNVERLTFGEEYLDFGEDSTAAQAYRLFRAAFDRAPDKTGLGYWVSQLEHGMSLKDVAKGFIESAEFSAGAGSGSSTSFFVSALYRNVFDREPDEAGLRFWSNAIDTGTSRAEVLAALSDSGENRAKVLAEIENGIEYTLW
jgi:hypothetical protein